MSAAESFASARSIGHDAWIGAARMNFAEGKEIYAQDEDADLIYRVIRGAVRTSHLLADVRRQIGDFYYEGEVFGLELSSTHRFSAETLTSCEIAMIRRTSPASGRDIQVDRLMWAAAGSELARAQSHMLLLGRTTAAEKVARFLLDVQARCSGDAAILPMSRQDMADYLGLTIETVSRMLSRFQSDGLIRFTGARRFNVVRPTSLAASAAF